MRGNERQRLLPAPRVGHPDHRHFLDSGILIENLLDLARIDVDAVDQQHVLFSICDVKVTVRVAVSDVARQQPAVAHGLRRGGGLAPVAQHDVGAAHTDFPRLAGRQQFARVGLNGNLHVGNGPPNRTVLPRAGDGLEGNDRTGFAQAVAFEEGDRKPGGEFAQNFARQRRAAADADAQRQRGGRGTAGESPKELRDGRQEGGLVLQDFHEDILGRMQGFDEDHRTSDQHGKQQADGQHEAVKERQHDGKPIRAHRFQRQPATLHVGQQIAMRKHRSFGMAGGARRVNEHRKVPLGQITRGRRPGVPVRAKGLGVERLQPALRDCQLGQPFIHRFIYDEDVDAGVGDDEAHFRRFEEVVEGHRDGARLQDAEQGGHEFRAVPEPDADAVAAPDAAARAQPFGDPEGLRPEIVVREGGIAPKEGRLGRVALGGGSESERQIH